MKNKIITISFIVILFGIFGANLIIKDTEISISERRKLAKFPEINSEDLLNGKWTKDFEKNDIVVIDYDGKIIIRRIIGVYGDQIDIDNSKGILLINDDNEDNQDIKGITVSDPLGIKFPLYVSENHYFVLCDDRSNTADSRKIGCINKSSIIGKVIISI